MSDFFDKEDLDPKGFFDQEDLDKISVSKSKPIESVQDFSTKFASELPFAGVLGKLGSAQLAAAQEVGDIFRSDKNKKDFSERYKQYEQERLGGIKQAEERSPIASVAGTGAAIATSLATPSGVIGTGMKGAGGLATRLGSTVGLSTLDTATRGKELFDTEAAKQAATLSGGIQAGLESMPVVAKIAKPAARYLSDKADDLQKFLDRFGSRRAAKAAGVMAKDVKRMRAESNKAQQIYDAMRRKDPSLPAKKIDKLADFGSDLLERGIVKFASNIDNIADDVSARYAKASDNLSNSISKLDDAAEKSNVVGAGISDNEVADEIEKYLTKKYSKTRAKKAKANAIKSELEIWREGGDVRRSLRDLNSEKSEYDDLINYRNVTATEKPLMEAKKEIRNILNKLIEKKADEVAKEIRDPSISKSWKEAKKEYGKLANIKETLEDRMATIEASNLISLRDTAVGAGVGGLYAAGTQDPASALAALPAALVTGALRKRGASATAVGAKKLAEGVEKTKKAAQSTGELLGQLRGSPVAQTATRSMIDPEEERKKEIEAYLNQRGAK